MKRAIPYIIIIVLFSAGTALIFYPSVSDYFYRKNSSSAIMKYEEVLAAFSEEDLNAELDAAYAYNKSIVENGIVLVDPYDPDAFPVTDGRYEDMLTLGSMMAQIEIPAINVYLPIYHNTDEATLAIGVGHIPNTSLPVGGQQTHCVLTAHTGLPSAKLFTDLNKLVEGDIFYIHVLNRTLTYKVDQIKVVLPYEIDDLTITQDDFVTLLTCTPYGVNSHRLLVRGARVNSNDNAVDNGINEPAQNAVANTFGRTPIDFFTPVIIVSAAAVLAVVLAVLMYAVSRRRKKR